MMDNSVNVTIGTFFFVGDELYTFKTQRPLKKSGVVATHFDFTFEYLWSKLLRYKYPTSHYYDHMRGEVAYDVDKDKYVIAISSEASDKMISRVASDFGICDYYAMRDSFYSIRQDTEAFTSQIFLYKCEDDIETTRVCKGKLCETLHFSGISDKLIRYLAQYNLYQALRRQIHAKRVYIPSKNTAMNIYLGMYKGAQLSITRDAIMPIYERIGTVSESAKFDEYISQMLLGVEHPTRTIAKLYLDSIDMNAQAPTETDIDILVEDSIRLAGGNICTYDFKRLANNLCKIYDHSPNAHALLSDIFNVIAVNALSTCYSKSDCELYAMALNVIHKKIYARENIHLFPDISDNKYFEKFLKAHYPYTLNTRVLRGEDELTGNLIEISAGRIQVLVECGTSLTNKSNALEEIEKEVLSNKYSAVIITHNHKDHNGLIDRISKTTPVFMGEKTLGIYKIQHPNADISNFIAYHDSEPITISNTIEITPHLCDHSAVDSYMLEFGYLGKTALYTGDFRANGRKNFSRLLSSLPTAVDSLITEGTNANSDIPVLSEIAIENRLRKIFSSTKEPAFAMCTSTNIDRIVSIYKAAKSCNKRLLVSFDEAQLLCYLGGSVPNPLTFSDVYVYYPHNIRATGTFLNIKRQSLHIEDIASMQDYVMIVSTSTLPYLKKLARARGTGLIDCPFIYSMWKGYLDEEWMSSFVHEMEYMGVTTHIAHTSGHADKKTLDLLKSHVHPAKTIEVHTRK